MAAVDELFTCAICLDLFKSPRRLPCHHVYCVECLRGLVKEETDHITCPECRRDHVVPNRRVDEFPVDGRLVQLIEKLANQKAVSDDCLKDNSALGKCRCCQPACQECRTHRAILVETILQESRQFRADFFTRKQKITRQKQKVRLHGYIENLQTLKIKVVTEIEDIHKELEKRKLTLLARIEEEEMLIVEDLSKFDQADIISAVHESLSADLLDNVLPTETLVSLRFKLSNQKELMTSLRIVNQNARLLDARFNSDDLLKLVESYGDFFTAVDYQKDFTIEATLDGSESGSIFHRPLGLTVCLLTDNVYVTDYTCVRVYNDSGEYIRHVVTNNDPSGLAIDSNQRVIVASFSKSNVNIYNHDLSLVNSFGSKGEKNGEFNGPVGVTCDKNDNIYVVDMGNCRIQVFTPDGTFLSVIGRDVLQNPHWLQINKRQEILVTDSKLGQVVIFSKDGAHLKSISGEPNNVLKGPSGICLDERNRILVADPLSKKIQVYNDDGTYHSTISQPAAAMTTLRGLAVTRSGAIYITDCDGNKLHRINSVQGPSINDVTRF